MKASNILVSVDKDGEYQCFVVDYECSIGVAGRGFFRTPKILQASKDRKISKRPQVFSKKVDVYGYGMMCYEILTGKLQFERHPQVEQYYDLVINIGLSPEVPNFVDDWAHDLHERCWQSNPADIPSFREILSLLEA